MTTTYRVDVVPEGGGQTEYTWKYAPLTELVYRQTLILNALKEAKNNAVRPLARTESVEVRKIARRDVESYAAELEALNAAINEKTKGWVAEVRS